MELYGLIGHPLGHSFSKNYFSERFRVHGLDAEYRNFDLPDLGELPYLIESHSELRGFNVTIPYKLAIVPMLDFVDPIAESIGAVNVVSITHEHNGQRRLKGYNTDVTGFTESLRPILEPHHSKALILGTGGASRAVAAGLDRLEIPYAFVSRSAACGRLTYADLDRPTIQEHTIIINATPLGTFPDVETCPDIPYGYLTPHHLCFDLVYNPPTTRFLELSARQGATVKNGLEMLHIQADETWRIWNH